MTELLINNQAVVLPDDFTFKIIKENPRFTKNGSYTLDLYIPLDVPQNAKLYSNMNRFHSTANITNRTATLWVDNKREFLGKEIILSIDNMAARIQLIAGNSDLNFNLRSDKIRDLNLGQVVSVPFMDYDTNPDNYYPYNQADTYRYLNERYPTKNFIHAPFFCADSEQFCNKWTYTNEHTPYDPALIEIGYMAPQPFLCAIIKKIINYYGYTIASGSNDLESNPSILQYYIVHGNITNEYAKMLPDWTVKEFFDEIEAYFDCRVLVQEDNSTVKIIFNKFFFESTTPYNFEMIKLFSFENLLDNTLDYFNANIGYDFDDYIYYRYARLDRKLKTLTIADSYSNSIDLYDKLNDTDDTNRHGKIFSGSLGQYVSIPDANSASFNAHKVDQFKDLIQNSKAEKDITFKIIPAPFIRNIDFVYDFNLKKNYGYWNQYPVALLSQKYAGIGNVNVSNILSGDADLPDQKITNKLYLAAWDGLRTINYVDTVPQYSLPGVPMAFTEYVAEYFDARQTPAYFNLGGLFRLETMKSTLYSTLGADTRKKYRISFKGSGTIDVRRIFIFDNKKFVCLKFERRFDKSGKHPIVDGEFYPVV